MPTISPRVPEKELDIFKSYAERNNAALSEITRTTMLKRIEDEYNLKVFAEYEVEKQAGTSKTRPVNELLEKLGLRPIGLSLPTNSISPSKNWTGKRKG